MMQQAVQVQRRKGLSKFRRKEKVQGGIESHDVAAVASLPDYLSVATQIFARYECEQGNTEGEQSEVESSRRDGSKGGEGQGRRRRRRMDWNASEGGEDRNGYHNCLDAAGHSLDFDGKL